MITRRHLLETAGAGAALAVSGLSLPKFSQAEAAGVDLTPGVPGGISSYVTMGTLPGKKPLIQLSDRPPNYEAPIEYLRTPITPNDQFYVRYHLADIPEVKAEGYKISVGGDGAMGCARWKGAKLKDVLDKVGLKKEAIEISFNGADGPAIDKTPDFIKSIPVWKATDEATIIAYEMNGAPLPHFNGFPARIIVPGWTGTYWMKHVITINALTKPQGGFWMTPAYRIPLGKFPLRARFTTHEYAPNTPITEMVVNSLITSHRDGAQVKAGKVAVSGMAWDGGYGIRSVQVSADGGKTWSTASLGQDLGPYAFRPWSFDLSAKRGKNTVMANATNKIGQSQTAELIFNPAGYHNNVMQNITLIA